MLLKFLLPYYKELKTISLQNKFGNKLKLLHECLPAHASLSKAMEITGHQQ